MNLTARGWALVGAGVAWCAVAFVVGQRDLWWPGLFLALLPVASLLLLLPGTARLRVQRRVNPARLGVGGTARVELLLEPGGIALGGVSRVRDLLPEALGEARWYGFAAGLGRWRQSVRYELRPHRRGRHAIGPVERSVADGLGLARARFTARGRTEVLVTPRVEPLSNQRGASGVGQATDTTLLRTGLGSADDVLVREYQQGDDVRRIHWRSSAHTGQLMVRREERAWDPSATVVVDNRALAYSSRAHDERLEWVVSAAASVSIHLLRDGFDLGLVAADGRVLSPHRLGSGREEVVLEHLAELATDPAPSLCEALGASGRGAEGQLLVAVLGRVDAADLDALADAGRHGRACWAVLVPRSREDANRADAVRATGWKCVVAGPGTPIAAAWRELGVEDER